MPKVAVAPVVAPVEWRLDASGWPVLAPTLLSLHRTSPLDEQSRQIICKLDGELRVELLFGQEVTLEIPPGPHVLRVHNTLVWKTLRFDVEPGGHVHYTVRNRAGRSYYPLLLALGAAPLWLEVDVGHP